VLQGLRFSFDCDGQELNQKIGTRVGYGENHRLNLQNADIQFLAEFSLHCGEVALGLLHLPTWKFPQTTMPLVEGSLAHEKATFPLDHGGDNANRHLQRGNTVRGKTPNDGFWRLNAALHYTPEPASPHFHWPAMSLPHGLYDLVLTLAAEHSLRQMPSAEGDLRDLTAEEAAERLSDSLGSELRRLLADASGTPKDQLQRQVALINGLLREVRTYLKVEDQEAEVIAEPPRILRAVHPRIAAPPVWPETGLAAPFLFTAGKGSPALVTELRREVGACDAIDILVSFITISGVRKLIDVLRSVTAAGATGEGRTRIRVLTTTYTGATQLEALDQLARLNGCQVKISLDGRRTRLHAKAWIFHRQTGFGSAYVGSANLSGAALMGGLEWTVRLQSGGSRLCMAGPRLISTRSGWTTSLQHTTLMMRIADSLSRRL
jgi:HKD family nuclease